MQRPAPRGSVRSAQAETETMSWTSTLTSDLSVCGDPDNLPGLCDTGFSALLTWER